MNPTAHQLSNPFPGLRPFRSGEHHLFFGREEQITTLLQLLRTNRFLAVVGTSATISFAPAPSPSPDPGQLLSGWLQMLNAWLAQLSHYHSWWQLWLSSWSARKAR